MVLLAETSLPFRLLKVFQYSTNLCESGTHPFPQGLLILEGLPLLREGRVVPGMLNLFLRTCLGTQSVMQRAHFLLSLLKEGIDQLNAMMREIGDARVWAGLHWRHSVKHGEKIGRHVAAYVTRNLFLPLD